LAAHTVPHRPTARQGQQDQDEISGAIHPHLITYRAPLLVLSCRPRYLKGKKYRGHTL
jgi:hypothetical protein